MVIARSFVENCEFKDQQYRGLPTDEMVQEFFNRARGNEAAELNLCIYVLIRDNKLLELRQKFEQ